MVTGGGRGNPSPTTRGGSLSQGQDDGRVTPGASRRAPHRSALGFRLGLGAGVTLGSSSSGRGCEGEDRVTFVGVEEAVHVQSPRPARASLSSDAPKPLTTFPHQNPHSSRTFSKVIFTGIFKSQKFYVLILTKNTQVDDLARSPPQAHEVPRVDSGERWRTHRERPRHPLPPARISVVENN